ncbi:hypothetical protein IFM89_025229, partial [Coptis chinensis]
MGFHLSTAELISFHAIDRELFHRLVITLHRNPRQVMEVIALWVWLEAVGYPSIIGRMGSLPDVVVIALFEEGLTCLYHIESNSPPNPMHDNIRLTANLMRDHFISLQVLYNNRVRGRNVISRTVNEIFTRAFEDIVQEAARALNTGNTDWTSSTKVQTTTDGYFSIVENGQTSQVVSPPAYVGLSAGYHPLINYGNDYMLPNLGLNGTEVQGHFEMGESSNQGAQSHAVVKHALLDEDRTLFLTFTRGYPTTGEEILDFFQRTYGNVVESVQMGETAPTVQPLYAYIVFHSASTLVAILDGNEAVMFVVNGKQ